MSAAVAPAKAAEPVAESAERDAPGLPARGLSLLLRPGTLGIIGQASLSAANFLTGVMLGRTCGDDCLGIYALAMTCVYVGIGIQSELTSGPYHVYCIRRRGRALHRYTGSVLLHQAVSLAALLVGIAAVLAVTGQLRELASVLGVLAVAGPLLVTREFVRQMTFARLRLRLAVVLDLVASGVQVGSLAAVWWLGLLSPATALACGASAGVVTIAIWLLRNRRELTLAPRLAWTHWLRNWMFGRWTVATYAAGSMIPFVMPWALAYWRDSAAVGRLAACNTLIGLSYMFTTGIANALTGQAARDYRAGGGDALMGTLRKAAAIIAGVLGPFLMAVAIAGDWAIAFVYGPDFAGLGQVSTLIAAGVLAGGLSMVAGNGLWAIERPQDGLVADLVTLAVSIVSAVLLIDRFGVIGAAAATLAGQAASMIVRWAALRRSLARSDA